MAEERFRRPAEHEQLLNTLCGRTGPFSAMYEAMMFAAAVGRTKGERVSFEKHGEPINLSRLDNRLFGDVLVDLLAAADCPDDPKVLSDDRLKERILIFEEYAHRGLNFIQGEINTSGGGDLTELISGLVMDALAPDVVSVNDRMKDMLDALEW